MAERYLASRTALTEPEFHIFQMASNDSSACGAPYLLQHRTIMFKRTYHRQDTRLHGGRQSRPSITQRLKIWIGYIMCHGFARTNCAGFCAAIT
jgi:hypothetical protein